MSAVELNEKLLMDAGGWQAMKLARGLCEAGRVVSANYTPPVLKGLVADAGTEFRAGLKIVSRTQVENICSCRAAREWGMICAHSLAVGLAALKSQAVPVPAVIPVAQPALAAQPARGPFFSFSEGRERVVLHVILSPNFPAAWEKDAVMMGVEVELAGRRILAQTLAPQVTYRATPEDVRALEALRATNEGELAGMLILPRVKARPVLEALRGHPRVTFGKTQPANVEALLKTLPRAQEAVDAGSVELGKVAVPGRPKFSLTVEGSLNQLTARLQAIYDRRVVTVGLTPVNDLFTYADPAQPAAGRLSRNVVAERQASERLTRWGFTGPDTMGQYSLKREGAILQFFARELPRLQEEWEVAIGARFTNITQGLERVTPRLEIQRAGEDWFELSVQMETADGQVFSAAEIQRLLQMGQNHVRLKNNRLAVFDTQMLDELQNVLVDCDPQQPQPGRYRIDRVHAGYLDAAIGDTAKITGSPGWHHWARTQRQLDAPQPIALGTLDEVLRRYQKEGVYWMNFLAQNGFGGILADEMGLGKTLQALAFLRARGGRSLIVCPSSLVYNWQREATRFTPELKTLAITGPNRERLFGQMAEADLLITSYPLLRRDGERYRTFEFAAAILDEAQHIKNPETQNAQAALGLRAQTRFVLTGTPIENSVRDLWSIMEFVLPGYLGSKADFRERYEQPISQGAGEQVRGRLAKRIRPFLLRRLKKSVATELPDKIEQVVFFELNANQASVYNELLKQGQNQIAESAGRKNEGQMRMLMLTTLLRLRQACCDLRLLNLPASRGSTSAKSEMLDELLREIIDGGHRVLIFSQFVSMLQLLRQQLASAEIACCYLDGATKDRAREVDRFQENSEIPVFLISLKAGGVGLNLTAADTVIHFDPWWNPAVEAQATDRAHRIGQRNVVTSYKLIARGTVEEKILSLQQKKRDLIEATIENEEPMMSGLTMDDIFSLLS